MLASSTRVIVRVIPVIRPSARDRVSRQQTLRSWVIPSLPVKSQPIDTVNAGKLIVVTLDGLATAALGCYGSSWNATPTIDAIASVGCLWDRCIAPSDDPLEVIKHWLFPPGQDRWQAYRDGGRVELICDDRRLIELGADQVFDQISFVNSLADSADQAADEIEQTAFGQLVAAAMDRGLQSAPWSLLWLHSCFLTTCWDAPRDRFEVGFSDPLDTDEEQTEGGKLDSIPAVFPQTRPPTLQIDEATHPDLVTSWMATYGCQIQLLDDLLDVLLQSIGGSDTIAILAGTSGFSFGQNGWIGHRAGPLRSCHTRLPLIIGAEGPLRWPRITTSDVLPELIAQLANGSLLHCSPDRWTEQDGEFDPQLITRGHDRAAVTTSRWFLVRDSDQSQHLFLKPDDTDDVNDVSRLRPEVVDRLTPRIAD